MATANDLLVVFGPYDISGEMNSGLGKNPVETTQYYCANPPGTTGLLPSPYRDAVSEDFTFASAGYLKGVQSGSALRDNITRNDVLLGVSNVRGVGQPVQFCKAARGDYTRTADVGDALKYEFTAMLGQAGTLWSGSQGAYADISATGSGAGFQFGAVAADERLVVAQAAERLSGTGSLITAWKIAAANTFVGEATAATLTSVAALGEEVVTAAGPFTNTWHRPGYAVTGTGVWRIRIFVAKQQA